MAFELSKWGDHHAVYAWGVQHGRRINRCSMAARAWLLLHCMSITDDFLIFHADPRECLKRAAPESAMEGRVTQDQVDAWLDECEQQGLIARFQSEGETWACFLQAPPKKTKNGKHAKRFPHPPETVARWDPEGFQWVPIDTSAGVHGCQARSAEPENPDVSGESGESRFANQSSDSRAEHSRAEQSTSISRSGGGGVGEVRSVLGRIGVEEPSLSRIADQDGITADQVIRQWLAIDGNARHPVGLLVSRLQRGGRQAGERPTPSLTAIVQAMQAGVIQRVSYGPGWESDLSQTQRFGRNEHGVYADQVLVVPAHQVDEVSFQ